MSLSDATQNPLENTSPKSEPLVTPTLRGRVPRAPPPDHLLIKVIQFSTDDDTLMKCCDLSSHWAIFVPTSTTSLDVGRFFEVLSCSVRGYHRRFIVDEPHPMRKSTQAVYNVGWVHPDHLDEMKKCVSGAMVMNCKKWVDGALNLLNGPHMYTTETTCSELEEKRGWNRYIDQFRRRRVYCGGSEDYGDLEDDSDLEDNSDLED